VGRLASVPARIGLFGYEIPEQYKSNRAIARAGLNSSIVYFALF
jgi:hypothetical protein